MRDGVIEARASAPSSRDPTEVMARCLSLVEQVRSADVTALGIGVPGQVHAAERRVLSGGYVDLSGFDLAGEVETATGLRVVLENEATMALPPDTRAEDLLARGDAPARAVIDAWAWPLRAAIDSLVTVINPDCVVIGGGAGAAAAALATLPPRASWFAAPVRAAHLGDDAGVIGAAQAALRACPRGKRAVLVNGVPASGKSSIARALSDATGWPLLTLDTIKNPFPTALPPGDRPFNRTQGRASYAAIFDLIADAPEGSTVLIDAWFGFQPIEVLTEGLARAGVTEVAEVWCHAPPDIIGARYAARLDSRPAGHPGAEYVPELIALARRAQATGVAPRFDLDSTQPPDLAALRRFLDATLSR